MYRGDVASSRNHKTEETSFMTDVDNIPKNVVKLRPATSAGGGALVQAKPKINISQLARQTGLSRQTVRRKLANGWQPATAPSVEIIEPTQSVAIMATPHGHLGQGLGSYWRVAGRVATGLVIAGCGIAIAVTSIRANAWFGRSLTTDATAGEIFSHLSVLAEIVACAIPTATRFYWQDGDRRTALKGVALMCLALTVVFFAASGFVLMNVSAGTELRGEWITPAVALAERTVNMLAKSREDECRKRGDRCRDLEAQERKAIADLAAARAEVRAMADPQAQALQSIRIPCAPCRRRPWSGCALPPGTSSRSVLDWSGRGADALAAARGRRRRARRSTRCS
jgi:hypothetical protein